MAILGAVLAFIALSGCAGTITPAAVESHQASFDEGAQNSGVVALIPGGAIITPRAHERYNGLIAIYGRDFLPTLTADYGITPRADGNFEISREALQKFILLNQWHRMGREPKNK
ncbi:MAG: hypothetical protein HY302_09330 [Opitutae bacterium]|nr:hypothetical protein [Opitutae bacterium]